MDVRAHEIAIRQSFPTAPAGGIARDLEIGQKYKIDVHIRQAATWNESVICDVHPDRWSFTQWFMINGQLLRGEFAKAQRGFDTYLRCMWLPGSWRENFREPHSRYAFGEQPDIFNALLYTEMLRNFLPREEGDELRIAEGVHRLWLPPGKEISVRNAPTEFGGIVDYTMRRSHDRKELLLEIENRRQAPREFVWTPRGFGKISGVKLNGRVHAATSGSVVFQGAKNRVELKLS